MINKEKYRIKLPFHIVKRLDMPKYWYWGVRSVSFLIALLFAGILCTLIKPGTFGVFYKYMFLGVFDSTDIEIFLEFIETMGILCVISFALAPAFKMRYWNIGAEGQILIGCLVTSACMKFMVAPNWLIIAVSLFSGVTAGAIWALIPAIFRAFFKTNETLFTLMMNYIAMVLIDLFINLWVPSGSMVMGILPNGQLPDLFGLPYLFNIIICGVVIIGMVTYLLITKHGYEVAVVGGSENTARYAGMNVKKIIIRTLLVSGGLCGLVGFMLVAGHHHTLSSNIAGGNGFTGVLITWLAYFEPRQIIIYSALVALFQCGSVNAASYIGLSYEYFSSIITGLFFLLVIASSFTVNFKIVWDKHKKNKNDSGSVEPLINNEDTNDDLKVEESPVKKDLEEEAKV